MGRWLLALAGVLALGLLVVLEPWLTTGERGQPIPSMHASGPAGARALALWLNDLGYVVRSTEHRPFELAPTDRLLLQLDPSDDPSEAAVDAILAWVERGGTLVLSAPSSNRMTDRLGLRIAARGPELAEATPLQPIFVAPAAGRVAVATAVDLGLPGPTWTPLLGDPADGRIVAATARRGRGRVVALATARPLTNAGLAQLDDAAFALRLLIDLPAGATVVFDEYHHGLTEHGTLGARLLGEPWGWALLYCAGLSFAYLALRGRRFGPIAPELLWPRPRPSAEHAATLAALLREGGQRGWLRDQYLTQLRRALGQRFQVPVDLPSADFGRALAGRRPAAAEVGVRIEAVEQAGGDRQLLSAIRQAEASRRRLMEGA